MDTTLIKNRFTSRRQFLKGIGSSFLLLPPLLSLMPKSLQASVSNEPVRRLVCYVGTLGIDPHQLHPTQAAFSDYQQIGVPEANIKVKPLKDFTDPISRVIDSSFTNNPTIRDKMNLIKGLSLTGGKYAGHNCGVLASVIAGGREPTIGKSIDVILEKSSSLYKPDDLIARKAARVEFGYGAKFSFDRDANGNRVYNSWMQGDSKLFNYLLGGLSEEGETLDKTKRNKNQSAVIDKVFADLTVLQEKRNRGLMSYEDSLTLERFTEGVNEVSKKLQANAVICQKPDISLAVQQNGNSYYFGDQNRKWIISAEGDTNPNNNIEDIEIMYDNILEIIKIAFECDLTRIVYIGSNYHNPKQPNGIHHDGTSEGSADAHQYGLKKMYRLAEKLDSVTDVYSGNGNTVLDNSMILWTNELGTWTSRHDILNLPTVTFGSQGGQFETGYFTDFSQPRGFSGIQFGRPQKQLLQAIMLSMGLSPNEYSAFGDGKGFGQFESGIDHGTKKFPDAFSYYANEHNDPVPFLYKNA